MQKRGATVVGLDVDERVGRAGAARTARRSTWVTSKRWSFPSSRGRSTPSLCGDLIEHLRDPQGFLTRIRPFLRPGAAGAQHSEHRELGDAAQPPVRPLPLHGVGNPRPDPHALVHAQDAGECLRRRDTASRSSTTPSPCPCSRRRASRRSRTRIGRLRPSLLRVPVRRRSQRRSVATASRRSNGASSTSAGARVLITGRERSRRECRQTQRKASGQSGGRERWHVLHGSAARTGPAAACRADRRPGSRSEAARRREVQRISVRRPRLQLGGGHDLVGEPTSSRRRACDLDRRHMRVSRCHAC